MLRDVRKAFAKPLEPDAVRPAIERALERLAPLAADDYAERALADGTERLPGLGPRRAELLAKREIRTVLDLLFLLPTAYDDRRALSRVGELEVGSRATFVARVLGCGFGTWRGGRGRGGQDVRGRGRRRHGHGEPEVVPRR